MFPFGDFTFLANLNNPDEMERNRISSVASVPLCFKDFGFKDFLASAWRSCPSLKSTSKNAQAACVHGREIPKIPKTQFYPSSSRNTSPCASAGKGCAMAPDDVLALNSTEIGSVVAFVNYKGVFRTVSIFNFCNSGNGTSSPHGHRNFGPTVRARQSCRRCFVG